MRGGERPAGLVRVLGIDPGTAVTGWGVVERAERDVVHVAHGAVTTHARMTLAAKLAKIHGALVELCALWRPDVVALEQSFVGRNVQSAFRLGEVRGVAMLAAASVGIAITEYSPATVKLAVTGSGRAEKEQVQRAIARELGVREPLAPDAADALAIALCHLQSSRLAALVLQGDRPRRRTLAGIAAGPR